MDWKLIELAKSSTRVRCSICMTDMEPTEAMVRFNPVKDMAKFFYYYHPACFKEQLKSLQGG